MATAPTFDELMWPALKALKAMGGSGTNEELLNKIIELEQVPAEIQAVQHTDHRQSRLNYNLAWAKTYLKKVGAIDNSRRGVWSITKEGEALTEAEVRLVPARVRKQIAEDRLKNGGAESQPAGEEFSGDGELESPELHWKDSLLGCFAVCRLMRSSDQHSGSYVRQASSKSKSRAEVVTVASTA